MTIIGIDPGTTRIGYGLIESGRKLKLIDYGVIECRKKQKPAQTIKEASDAVRALFKKYSPELMGIEKIYFSKNVKTGLAVAQTRGAILREAAEYGISVSELSPSEVKMAITNYGLAAKKAVAKMAAAILGIKELEGPDDAGDALAIAITASMKSNDNYNR